MARSESCDKAEEGRGWAEPHLWFSFLLMWICMVSHRLDWIVAYVMRAGGLR